MPSISENHSSCNESKKSMHASNIKKSADRLSQPSQFFSSGSVTHLIQPKCEPVETDAPVSPSLTNFNIDVCSNSITVDTTDTDNSLQICKTEYFVQEPLPAVLTCPASNYSETGKLPDVKIENFAENPACSLSLSEVSQFSMSNQVPPVSCKEEVHLDLMEKTNSTLNTLDTCQTQSAIENTPYQIKSARSLKYSQKLENQSIKETAKRQRDMAKKKEKSYSNRGVDNKIGERDSNGQLVYRCRIPDCGREFSSRGTYHWHLEWHNGTNFVCAYCNKKFYRKFILSRHIEIHHMDKGIQHACPIAQCERVFKRADHLKKHMVTHNRNKNFFCEHCNNGFWSREHLIRHLKRHLKVTPKEPNGSDNDLFKQLKRNRCPCPNCNLEDGKKIRDSNGKLQHLCHYPDCGKIFNETSGLKHHLVTHSGKKNFVCTTCNRPYTTKSNLVAHMKIHAVVRTIYECPQCDKKFLRKNALNFHLKKHEIVQKKEPKNESMNKPKMQNSYNLRPSRSLQKK